MSDPAAKQSAAEAFVEKWSRAELTERAASHEHFLDLCRLLDQPTPASDATGEDYCFEKHVQVVGSASKGSKGLHGFVDVWKRDCFAWEYKAKGKHKTLADAYRQVYQYRDALDNPPLTVVCDISTIEIRPHFPGYPSTPTIVRLEEVPAKLDTLRHLFTHPHYFRPAKDRQKQTQDLSLMFGDLASNLIERFPPDDITLFERAGDPVAHFLMKVMFCLFCEDIGLLPNRLFTKIVDHACYEPDSFVPQCAQLFEKMQKGGFFGGDRIAYFNGGLFDDKPPIALNLKELPKLAAAARADWSGVEPSIFGTLFERILDPKKRAQIGAHYTSREDILLVIEPVIMAPLRRRWRAVQEGLADAVAAHAAEPNATKRKPLAAPIVAAVDAFRVELGKQRVLDPACGSGNFLYVAIQSLLALDDEAVRFCALRGLWLDPIPHVRPTQLHGIEINPYAAELAQVVIWIGYLQWMHEHRISDPRRPILDKLETVEHRDAILDLSDKKHPAPAKWPVADFIVGNPPFLGSKFFRKKNIPEAYIAALYSAFADATGRPVLARTSNLCCYWLEIGRRMLAEGAKSRFGLLATERVRGPANRAVLKGIKAAGDIFEAWSDRDWVLDGAQVHTSIICFDDGSETLRRLDGLTVSTINSDLTGGADFSTAKKLSQNKRIAFMADTKGGAFDIDLSSARAMLAQPNASGKSNNRVVRRWINGDDYLDRPLGTYIVDFGVDCDLPAAACYEKPLKHVELHVRDAVRNTDGSDKDHWWLHERPRPEMRERLPAKRFIVTPNTSKHSLFAYIDGDVLPDHQLIAFARDDDYFLGVLCSAPHELWARRKGGQLREVESGFRYQPTEIFETFALPWPPGKEDTGHSADAHARIAAAAKALNEQRERWLNPPEWVEPLAARIDAADAFDDVPAEARALVRQSAIMAAAAKDARLKKRTLTNLYNERPTWLRIAHEALDRAVLAAYAAVDPDGEWSEDWAAVWVDTGAGQPLPADHPLAARRAEVDAAVLANLLRMNHERAGVRHGVAAGSS